MEVCDPNGCRLSDRRVDTTDFSAERPDKLSFERIIYRGENLAELHARADEGDSTSAYLLGLVSLHGLADRKKDLRRAFAWFRQSAEQGLPEGQYQTSAMILKSQGTHLDSARALRLLHAAATAREPRSLWTLGTLFAKGKFVQQDSREAFRFFKQAADAGVPEAMHNVGGMYMSGKGVIADPYRAMVYLKKAAERDVHEAQRTLGFLHARGLHGFPEDLPEARRWLSIASARGDEDAERELAIVQGKIAHDPRYDSFRRWPHVRVYTAIIKPYWLLYPYRRLY